MKLIAFNINGRRCGETHQRAKFTDAEIASIKYLREEGKLSFSAIAAKWDEDGRTISKSTVRDIYRGKIRAHHPTTFKPEKSE